MYIFPKLSTARSRDGDGSTHFPTICSLPLAIVCHQIARNVSGNLLPGLYLRQTMTAPTFSTLQATFLIVMSLGLYGVFLAIQNLRHRDYFVAPRPAKSVDGQSAQGHGDHGARSVSYHLPLLLAYLLPLVI